MKTGIYTLYDIKAGIFTPPMLLTNDQVAKRVLANCANDKTHNVGQNPEDFHVYKNGEYDDTTGVIEPYNPPQILASAISVLKREG